MDPEFAQHPAFDALIFCDETNVMDGEKNHRSFQSPFRPSECGEVNVPGDVEYAGVNFPSVSDDFDSVANPFAEPSKLVPVRLFIVRPSFYYFLEGVFNAEVAEGSLFTE